jgi:hypothetical protein
MSPMHVVAQALRRGVQVMPALLALLALMQLPALAEEAPGPQAQVRPYGLQDHLPMGWGESGCSESWFYEFHLDSGQRLLVNFLRTNQYFLGPVLGLQIWLMGRDRKPLYLGRELPAERFRLERNPLALVWGRTGSMAGLPPDNHRVRVATNKPPGLALDAVFSEMTPGFVQGDGIILRGKGSP